MFTLCADPQAVTTEGNAHDSEPSIRSDRRERRRKGSHQGHDSPTSTRYKGWDWRCIVRVTVSARVTVRAKDVVRAHIKAMTHPQAPGTRVGIGVV